MTNPFRNRRRRSGRGGSRADFRDSAKNLFKRIREEPIISLLHSLTQGALKPFNQRQSGRNWRDTRQIIQDFNRSITLIADIEALIPSIVDRIKEMFGTDRVILLHAYPDSNVFSLAFSLGYDPETLTGVHLTQRDRLAKWLLTNETALILDQDQGVMSYLSATEREMLERIDARVCVPMLALNRLTGLMLLSSTQKGWRLSEEELNLLLMLLTQASIAFESAYLSQFQRDRMRRLYRAERLATVGQLAASVAHEIRNPMTAIRSTVQYLLREFDENSPKRELAQGVIAEVDRIDRIVDGLLSLTRRAEFTPSRISLAQLIEQSILLVRTQAHEQAINILWEGPPQEVYVMADAAQLKQLALNLVMNAMQAMPNGGRLRIDLGVRSQPLGLPVEKEWAVISITDTGCGIPPETLDRVFDPFFTTKPGGTGLGLSTCYAIAKQHNGDLEISSQENEGTTVSLRLPLAR
ncbi:MAG TPA: ATP-binding protein [Blastocatellia bacterium]|nr:ATP-binding protein [Blastocatellia bacterium]